MTIIEKSYNWNSALTVRSSTKYIIVHHAAASKASADDIHKIHLGKGWAGIGYHFYVRKDGSVYQGRPTDKVGAHTTGYNSQSVGICFEGNFESETMSEVQKKAGQELILYLKSIYPKAEIKRHRDFNPTACPGKNFPFDEISKGTPKKSLTTVNDIVWELNYRGIISNTSLWLKKLEADENAYWLANKAANLTVNRSNAISLESINDIVWELNHRGILTDTALWLKKIADDTDLYHLAKKIANMTANKGA